jgi:hypothetical protein
MQCRDFEDTEKMDRLEEERLELLVENRELKQKLEKKKYKIEALKGNLATALAQAGLSIDDVERIQYEKEQQELRRAALQNFKLAPFCDSVRIKEESSIPFNDIGERIIVRDGKKIKQWILDYRFSETGEEKHLYQESEMTKRELEEMEKEEEEKRIAEAEKQNVEDQIRISEEEPSIPYDENNERIISRNGKTYKQWFQCGFGTHIWYGEKEISHDECSAGAGSADDADDSGKQAEKYVMSRLCSNREYDFMATCDNQKSMPFCCECECLDKEKELDEWIEEQEEKARFGFGRFDVSGRLRL